MTCNRTMLRVTRVTVTETGVTLEVTNSTNLANHQPIAFKCCKHIADFVTTELPVTINVNGEDVVLYNKFSEPVLSSKIPRRACGSYVTATGGVNYVILHTTPQD